MNCYFDMQRSHTEFADHTAYARLTSAISENRQFVGHRANDDLLWSYVRGCRMEMAYYLWLGGKNKGARWNAFFADTTKENMSAPDIIFKFYPIDVKARPENWTEFIVRRQSLKIGHAYVLASDEEYPRCIFHGWMWGSEVAHRRLGGRPDIPGHIIQADDAQLKDCMMMKWAQEVDVPRETSERTGQFSGA
jgi:hypothetical protein